MTLSLRVLKGTLSFIGVTHILIGAGLMFSASFQTWTAGTYGASFDWGIREVYLVRVLGSFIVVLGSVSLLAARNPLQQGPVVVGLAEFFLLRNLHRHMYAGELRQGFDVSATVNLATSAVFTVLLLLLVVSYLMARRAEKLGAMSSSTSLQNE